MSPRIPLLLAALLLAGCLRSPVPAPAEAPLVTDADVARLRSPLHNLTILSLANGTLAQLTDATSGAPRFLDEHRVAFGTERGVALLDLRTGERRDVGEGTLLGAGGGLVFLASSGDAPAVRAYHASDGSTREVHAGRCAPYDGDASDDGRLLALAVVCEATSSGRDGRIHLLDVATGALQPLGPGDAPSFAPDGSLVFVREGDVVRRTSAGDEEVLRRAEPGLRWYRATLDAQGRLWLHAMLGVGASDELRVREPGGEERVVVATTRYALLHHDVSPEGGLVALGFVRERDAT